MPRIVIADDEWVTRVEIEEMLTDLGHEVVGQAESGAEAIGMVRNLEPDLIIMDVMMPGEMNGIEAARVIKAEWGTPIIFVTGYGDPEYIEAAKEIAPFGYVMKPFDEKEIHAFVEIALSKRELEVKLMKAHEDLERANLILHKEIATRKKTEKDLRESEKLYRDIFKKNKAIKWILDPTTGKIIDANPAACEFYQYTYEEMTKLYLWDINLLGETEMKKYLARAESGVQSEYTFRHRLASGEIRTVQVFTGMVVSGGKKLLHSIIIDITDRHRAEEKLRMIKDKYQSLAGSITDIFFAMDKDLRYTYWNKASEKLTGIPAEKAVGKTLMEVFPDNEAREQVKKLYLRVIETKKPKQLVVKYPGNEKIVHEISAYPNMEGVSVFVKDITEQKRLEEEKEELQEALVESEAKYRQLLNTAPAGIYEVDFIKQKFTHVNEAICEYTGYSREEFLSMSPFDVLTEEGKKVFSERLTKLFAGKKVPNSVEFKAVRKDGTEFWALTNISYLYENEKLKGARVVVHDITDRKKAEEALRESEENLRAITDTALDPIFCKDTNRRTTFVNPAMLQLMGCTEADLIGKTPEEIFDEENAVIVNEVDERTLNGEEVNEIRSLAIAGRTYTLQTIQVPLRDADGNVIGISGIVRDMTDFVQAREALRQNKEKYRKLVEEINDVVYSIDEAGILTYVSPSVKSIIGYEASELIGRSFTGIIHPDDMPRIVERFKEVLSHILEPSEYRLVTKSGEIRWVRTFSRPIFKGNLVTGLRGVLMDITESKRLQAQLLHSRKMEAIGTLTGGIAHDYNNLMAIIMGNLSLAQEEAEPGSDLVDFLNEIDTASRKARDLTHELMSLSRGGGPVREVVSIVELLKSVSEIIPDDSGISLLESISQDLKSVTYDRLKMRAAIRNVVENAVEAMPDGGTLKIKAENLRIEETEQNSHFPLKPGDFVHISIQDQGNGIPEEHLDKIFDPYFSSKERGVQKGMGLGLTTAYAIIKQHGGHIQIDSSFGVGTTVNIYLPAESDPEQMDSAITSTDDKTSPVKRVLVMDDEEGLRHLVRKMLERLGYEVAVAKDGVEALQKYKKHMDAGMPFDAVILDLTIKGGMGGEQTIQELLNIDPDVKAIVSSGYYNDPVMGDFDKYGFKNAMTKPYQKADLEGVLKSIL